MNHDVALVGVGIGFKPMHMESLLAETAAVDFIEVHAENYMGAGGLPHHQLTQLRERLPLSVHGVGLSLGGEAALDEAHLSRLKKLVSRYQPAIVSEHLAWSVHDGRFLADLLPISYNDANLDRMCRHVDQVQSLLQRQLLIENPSHYVLMNDDSMTEVAFLRQLVKRTGCALLLDLNNVMVSCHNTGITSGRYLADFPFAAVAEIHLAGHSNITLDGGGTLHLDDHGSAVSAATWRLYRDVLGALARAGRGATPTLIEWDRNIPAWPALLAESQRARRYQQQRADNPLRTEVVDANA